MERWRVRLLSAFAVGLVAGWAARARWGDEARREAGPAVTGAGRAAVRVSLRADGVLTSALRDRPAETIGTLGGADAGRQGATIEGLRRRLEEVAAGGPPDAEEPFGPTLDLAADAATPWLHALWILEVAASPRVRASQVRLRVLGAAAPSVLQDIEYGSGSTIVDVGQTSIPVLVARLRAEDRGGSGVGSPTTRVSLVRTNAAREDEAGDGLADLDVAGRTGWATYEGVRRLAAECRAAEGAVEAAVLEVPRPQRRRVPYGDVVTVLRALHDEGIAPVWILHRSTVLPASR